MKLGGGLHRFRKFAKFHTFFYFEGRLSLSSFKLITPFCFLAVQVRFATNEAAQTDANCGTMDNRQLWHHG